MSEQQIYLNGSFVPKEKALISVFDHGLLYGDGCFEGIRAYGRNCFCLDEHVERLYNSARLISLEVGLTPEAFADVVIEVLKRNYDWLSETYARANGGRKMETCYVRPVVTRGDGDLGLCPTKCRKANVFVIADLLKLYAAEKYESGLDVVIVKTRRNLSSAIPPAVKSLNYLNNVLAKLEVNSAKADEGILLNADGLVAEATADNIFIVRRGVLETPPVELGALPGITRGVVMGLAREAGIEVRESHLKPEDLFASEECFLTGTGAEVIPVKRIDGEAIGDGRWPVTRRLIGLFHGVTARRGRAF